jgi:hypothetical protein
MILFEYGSDFFSYLSIAIDFGRQACLAGRIYL